MQDLQDAWGDLGGFARPGLILAVGGANLDIRARIAGRVMSASSNPGVVTVAPGGVARNIAHALALLGERVSLLSAVGDDEHGEQLLSACEAAGIDCRHVRRIPGPTGIHIATLGSDGELVIGVSHMTAVGQLRPCEIAEVERTIEEAAVVVADTHISSETLLALGQRTERHSVPLVIEPVSVAKSARIRTLIAAGLPIALITPNRDELGALTGHRVVHMDDVVKATDILHEQGVERLVVGLGPEGIFVSSSEGRVRLPARAELSMDTSGGSDVGLAALIWALRDGADLVNAARAGQVAAALAVSSDENVPEKLAPSLLSRAMAHASAIPERS